MSDDFADDDEFVDEHERDELSTLLGLSAGALLRSAAPGRFLDWISDLGPLIATGLAAQVDPRTGPVSAAFRAIGVAIYNAMPQPEAGFRPLKLRAPGRNEPCYCGSGRKFKHCCLALAGVLDLHQYNLLRHMLDAMPQKRFAELPGSHADPEAVADTARQWREEEAPKRAVALLDPWFAPGRPLNVALEPLFDELMDAYADLGKPRKRKQLIEQVLAHGDQGLRAAALQRRSTIEADSGDFERAWATFEEAQRTDPDNLAHAGLEITLLLSRGLTTQARERARFWIARLQRMRDPGLEDLIGFLRRVEAEPHTAMTQIDHAQHKHLERLAQLFATAPPAGAHYELQDGGGGECMLAPRAALALLDAEWYAVYPRMKPMLSAVQMDTDVMWEDAGAWLGLLGKCPLAWNSFNVLDDLVMAVEVLPTLGAGVTLLDPLLDRAVKLLDANLADASANQTLPWGWLENRPPLRMLAHAAYRELGPPSNTPPSTRFVALAEHLLALNPNDNHGIRAPLSRALLMRGADLKVVALAARFPDDFCDVTLNGLLALHRLGRVDDAAARLRNIADGERVAIDMLLKARARAPRGHGRDNFTDQGESDAWLYRRDCRDLWQQAGALEWLRKAWSTLA